MQSNNDAVVQRQLWYKKHKSTLIKTIWFTTVLSIGLLYWALKPGNPQEKYQKDMKWYNMQMRGGPNYLELLMWYWWIVVPIILGALLSLRVLHLAGEKNRCTAHLLAAFPIVPLNRLYTGHFWTWSTLIRMIPLIGNIMDMILYDWDIMKLKSPMEWTPETRDCRFLCCVNPGGGFV